MVHGKNSHLSSRFLFVITVHGVVQGCACTCVGLLKCEAVCECVFSSICLVGTWLCVYISVLALNACSGIWGCADFS